MASQVRSVPRHVRATQSPATCRSQATPPRCRYTKTPSAATSRFRATLALLRSLTTQFKTCSSVRATRHRSREEKILPRANKASAQISRNDWRQTRGDGEITDGLTSDSVSPNHTGARVLRRKWRLLGSMQRSTSSGSLGLARSSTVKTTLRFVCLKRLGSKSNDTAWSWAWIQSCFPSPRRLVGDCARGQVAVRRLPTATGVANPYRPVHELRLVHLRSKGGHDPETIPAGKCDNAQAPDCGLMVSARFPFSIIFQLRHSENCENAANPACF